MTGSLPRARRHETASVTTTLWSGGTTAGTRASSRVQRESAHTTLQPIANRDRSMWSSRWSPGQGGRRRVARHQRRHADMLGIPNRGRSVVDSSMTMLLFFALTATSQRIPPAPGLTARSADIILASEAPTAVRLDADPAERNLVRSRLKPLLVGLLTLAMVVFGQVCALSTLMARATPSEVLATESVSTTDEANACSHSDCEGDEQSGQTGHSGCPSGASSCCSTWGPPCDRLSLAPPPSVLISGADVWLVADDLHAIEGRASEVALFELARPPGLPKDAFLASSLSRRGPPALS